MLIPTTKSKVMPAANPIHLAMPGRMKLITKQLSVSNNNRKIVMVIKRIMFLITLPPSKVRCMIRLIHLVNFQLPYLPSTNENISN